MTTPRRSRRTASRRSPAILLAVVGLVLVAAATGLLLLGDDEQGDPAELRPLGHSSAETGAGALPAPARSPAGAELAPPRGPAAERIEQPVVRLGPKEIAGRVIDGQTEQPVTSFQVDVLPHDPGRDPMERLTDSTSQPFHTRFGVFRVEQKPGLYDVVVHAPGYRPSFLTALPVPADDGTPIAFVMDRGSGIAGQVYDVHGLPVPDVPVFLEVLRLVNDVPAPERKIARADEHGEFHFSPLPQGQYALTLLERGNLLDRQGPVYVGQGLTRISMPLTPRHQVLLRVQDLQGRAVGGARVELRGSGRVFDERTAGEGQVVFRHVPEGSYRVTIRCEGFAPFEDGFVLQGLQGEAVRWFTLRRPDES